jgi:hypothetical protein
MFWCRKCLSSPSYQERFWSEPQIFKIQVTWKIPLHQFFSSKLHEFAFALHSNVPCYSSRLPYWSVQPTLLLPPFSRLHLLLFQAQHSDTWQWLTWFWNCSDTFFKISFWLRTPSQCFWPGIMSKWTVCVLWVICHNVSHIYGLVLIHDMGKNLLSGSRN